MTLKWRFSGGILFSLLLHFFLLSALLYWYPGMIGRSDQPWQEWSQFLAEKILPSGTVSKTTPETSAKMTTATLIFPDIVFYRQQKKLLIITPSKKKKSKPKLSFNNILSQIEKFPERLKVSKDSKNPFSSQVVSLLTLLKPVSLQNQKAKIGTTNLNAVELLNYRKELEAFLSEQWKVPINLVGSTNTVVVKFEINKDGRILKWYQAETGNTLLYKSVKNLLKNLQFLPALPKSYPEDSYKFGIRFSPANFK